MAIAVARGVRESLLLTALNQASGCLRRRRHRQDDGDWVMKSIRLVMRLGLCLVGVALLPTSGHAQFYQPTHNTSIQIEYREPIPANGDMTALR
jgi:hypothetical protein